MILAAGVLVLVGLGLFVAGVATGTTTLYWLCVAACAAAGVLLVAARLRIGRTGTARPAAGGTAQASSPAPAAAVVPAAAGTASAAGTATSTTGTAQLPAAEVTAAPVAGAPAEPVPAEPVPAETAPSTGAHTARPEKAAPAAPAAAGPGGDPAVEEVEVTDLLLVVDLRDEVLVVDEHPRYHLAGCPWLAGRTTIPLPVDEARTDGFTPCARCAPDRNLAERERARRAR